MRYACLVYFDPQKVFDQSPAGESVVRDSMNPLNAIRTSGQVVDEIALELPARAMTVKVRDGKSSITDGPFAEAKEVLGGIVAIEAGDMHEAVRLAGLIPLARLGAVEVRPFVDFSKPPPKL